VSRQFYMCCGREKDSALFCPETFPVLGSDKNRELAKERAREAGWFVWADNRQRGLVLCPRHKAAVVGGPAEERAR
jgi:hypothetical protein